MKRECGFGRNECKKAIKCVVNILIFLSLFPSPGERSAEAQEEVILLPVQNCHFICNKHHLLIHLGFSS